MVQLSALSNIETSSAAGEPFCKCKTTVHFAFTMLCYLIFNVKVG